MRRFDTLKLLIKKENYIIHNPDIFVRGYFKKSKEETKVSDKKFLDKELINNNTPGIVDLYIKGKTQELVLTVSSKILKENYFDLLNKNNIEVIYFCLLKLGIKVKSYNTFLKKTLVLITHECLNVKLEISCEFLIKIINNYKMKNANYSFDIVRKSTLNMNKDSNDYRAAMNLTIYDKLKSLISNKVDKKFIRWLKKNGYNSEKVLKDFEDIIRLEKKIDSFEKIRKEYNVKENTLEAVLNSDENVISKALSEILNLNEAEEVYREYQEKAEKRKVKEIIKAMGYNLLGILFDYDYKLAYMKLSKIASVTGYYKDELKDNFFLYINQSPSNHEEIKKYAQQVLQEHFNLPKNMELIVLQKFLQAVKDAEETGNSDTHNHNTVDCIEYISA